MAKEQQQLIAGFERRFDASPRKLFVALKAHLRKAYEPTTLIDGYKVVTEKLIRRGRKPLLFANTDTELKRIMACLKNGRTWGKSGPEPSDSNGPIVVTIHSASQGINFQAHADVIISRPQPGDVLEQMKGRIDRPGQPRNDLELYILMAENTVEEVEAANIKLCGSFFRMHIAPHSTKYESVAVDALVTGKTRNVGKSFLKLCGTAWADVVRINEQITCSAGTSSPGGSKKLSKKRELQVVPSASCPAWKKPKSEIKARKIGEDLGSSVPTESSPLVLTADEVVRAGKHLCKVDSKLHKLISRVGLGCIPTVQSSLHSNDAAFQALARGIIFQQISVTVGNVITDRLIDRCGGKERFTPAQVLSIPIIELCGGENAAGEKNVGLSGTKCKYIRSLASAFVNGELDVGSMARLSDKDLCIQLCKVKGIGEWTAGVFMMHHLLRRDILLYGDLNVRMAMRDLYDLHPVVAVHRETDVSGAEDLPDSPEVRMLMDAKAECWRPYRTVVCHLLWNYHENPEAFYVLG